MSLLPLVPNKADNLFTSLRGNAVVSRQLIGRNAVSLSRFSLSALQSIPNHLGQLGFSFLLKAATFLPLPFRFVFFRLLSFLFGTKPGFFLFLPLPFMPGTQTSILFLFVGHCFTMRMQYL